jgi:hypothetical protein
MLAFCKYDGVLSRDIAVVTFVRQAIVEDDAGHVISIKLWPKAHNKKHKISQLENLAEIRYRGALVEFRKPPFSKLEHFRDSV